MLCVRSHHRNRIRNEKWGVREKNERSGSSGWRSQDARDGAAYTEAGGWDQTRSCDQEDRPKDLWAQALGPVYGLRSNNRSGKRQRAAFISRSGHLSLIDWT